MAYIRGANYIWSDIDRLHIWAADGNDEWRDTGWAEEVHAQSPAPTPHGGPSGVGLQQEAADLYVVMRFAQLWQGDRLTDVVEQAVGKFGRNGGCLALTRLAPALLQRLGTPPPETVD
jgi:hypothetical protein